MTPHSVNSEICQVPSALKARPRGTYLFVDIGVKTVVNLISTQVHLSSCSSSPLSRQLKTGELERDLRFI